MIAWTLVCCSVALIAGVSATTIFSEPFHKGWNDRWVVSDWKKNEGTNGKWGWSHGDFYGDAKEDKGLSTTQDARDYAISAKMTDEPFDNDGKTLVIQYSVKLPYLLDCGGGYIKLMRKDHDQKTFSGASPYAIMFGPDVCGSSKRTTHAIFNYKGKNVEKTEVVNCETDKFTHFYTLILKPDNTYKIKVDNIERASGSLVDGWDFLPPQKIPDPSAKKPDDWVDSPQMDDPDDKKPDDWDDEPEKIPDPDAVKPDDWDDEADGEWEVPMIPNPKYKGVWKAKRIDNPDYKGKWEAPMIDNPEFNMDDKLYLQKDLQYVGFELWQVKSGMILDNILITDSESEASQAASAWLKSNKLGESKMNEDIETEERIKAEKERREKEGLPLEDPDELEDDIDLDTDNDDDDKDEL